MTPAISITPTTEADHERERIAALREYDIIDRPMERGLYALAELAARACRTGSAVINLIDDRHQYQVATNGFDPSVCDRQESMCAVTVQQRHTVVVPDASRDHRFATNPWVNGVRGTIRLYAASPLCTPGGHLIGTLCVFDERVRELRKAEQEALETLSEVAVDILELRRRSMQLRDTVAELSRSHGELSAFAAQVSHDLKTPLTAMLGFGELLTDHPTVAADEVIRGYVARLMSASLRMMTTIDDLLRFAGVGGALNLSPVPVRAVVTEVLDDLSDLAGGAQVRCDDASVWADRVQLRLLLQNLISNSLRYRRPDRPSEIAVTVASLGVGSELRVVDNGMGIPEEKRLGVLSPLVRLQPQIVGTGLGLATCERIAAAHGGRLMITETAGGGTTVCVTLP